MEIVPFISRNGDWRLTLHLPFTPAAGRAIARCSRNTSQVENGSRIRRSNWFTYLINTLTLVAVINILDKAEITRTTASIRKTFNQRNV